MARTSGGRLCTICTHPQMDAINAALVAHHLSYRRIAAQYGLEEVSLRRHMTNHLHDIIQQSRELRMLASTESLIAELNALHAHVQGVLERGERTANDDLILRAVREGRLNVESLAKLGPLGDLEARVAALEAGDRDDDHGAD